MKIRSAKSFGGVLTLLAFSYAIVFVAPCSIAEGGDTSLKNSLTNIRDSKALLKAAEPLVEGPVWQHLRQQLQEATKTNVKFKILSDGLVQLTVENRMVTIAIDKKDGEILFNRKKVVIDWFGTPEVELKKLSDALPRMNAGESVSRLFFSDAEAAVLYPAILAVGAGAIVVIENYYKCGAIESAHKRCEKFATIEEDKETQNEYSREKADNYVLGNSQDNAVQYGQALAKSAFLCSKRKALESCLTSRGFDVKQLVGNPSLGEKARKPSGTAK